MLNLARGMSYKAAMAGLDLGGGKAVIIGDPLTDKTPALLRAYGRFVQSLGGRYYTACDVGTYSEDMDVIAEECRFVTGRTVAQGGAGDSSVLTAYGVFQGMRAAAEATWGAPTLAGRTVGRRRRRQGRPPPRRAPARGRRRGRRHRRLRARRARGSARPTPRCGPSPTPTALVAAPLDVYSPCALGDALTDEVVATLQRPGRVRGARTTSSPTPAWRSSSPTAGILYAPDYVVNAGGLIQVADELHGFDFERARERASRIFDTTLEVFALAAADGVPPAVAADRIAEQRMADARRRGDRGIWLP